MDDDEIEYAFLDPWLLLQGLVANSKPRQVRAALLAVMEALTSPEEETQVAASDVMELIAHYLLWGHVHDAECERAMQEQEHDDIIAKWRTELDQKLKGDEDE